MRFLNRHRGFTLVELMIVVAIIGVLAALAIYGVGRYMRHSKTSEAKGAVGAIARGNISYFNSEQWQSTTVLAAGATAEPKNVICASATGAVPGVTSVQGKKYQSKEADWRQDAKAKGTGFFCLKFSVDQPQYYSYDYKAQDPDSLTATFTAYAYGDLNGDGVTSTFEYDGAIQNTRVTMSPAVRETAAEE